MARQRDFCAGFDHTLPDYPTILEKGIAGIAGGIEDRLRKGTDEKGGEMLRSAQAALVELSDFIAASGHSSIARDKPHTLKEAAELVWLIHLAMARQGRNHNALGRVDQYLLPFYRNNIETGLTTPELALETLCTLWRNVGSLSQITNICIGGQTPGGNDAVNELSYLCIEATRVVHSPSTNLSARLHDGSPHRFIEACASLIRTGTGFPAIYNDETVIPALSSLGIPLQDARDYCLVGCAEYMIPGQQPAWSDSRFNLLLCLSNALDAAAAEPSADYQRLTELFCGLMRGRLKEHAERINTHILSFPVSEYPDPLLSALSRHCIENARDINDHGEPFPRLHGIAGMGLATTADSLAAVKKLVFEENRISLMDLKTALDADFQGHERIRGLLLNHAPKYGNQDPYVDGIAAEITARFSAECLNLRLPCGGRFVSCLAANVQNIDAGKEVKATPDGRYAFTPLSDAASPYFGRDAKGPTAFIGSVAAPDYTKVAGCTVINLRFDPDCFEGAEGNRLFASILRVVIKRRIPQMQFNFTDQKILLEALENPELHRNLIIRVSGFSAYFVSLSREVQNDIIRRRAHSAGAQA